MRALDVPASFLRAEVPPPPKIAWLPVDRLVVDETYQRGLSVESLKLIRRLASRWDWRRFKPLSVVPSAGGAYEIIDGQHTAIAAATNGAIELLPCLVLDASTLAEKSAAFVGINSDRLGLTPFAIFKAKLLAGDDPIALEIDAAVKAAGAQLIDNRSNRRDCFPVGTVSAIKSMVTIIKRYGREVLERILMIAIQGDVCLINAALIGGIGRAIHSDDAPFDEDLAAAVRRIGGEHVVHQAMLAWRTGMAPNIDTACERILLNACGR